MIFNGNFEAGNTGFSTALTFSTGSFLDQSEYGILSDPSDQHPYAASFGDHTSGSGLMMAVNGATAAGVLVWSQGVRVTKNTDYEFGVWIATWYPTSPADLQVLINGATITNFDAPAPMGVWVQHTVHWESGSQGYAFIEIIDLNTNADGNDFAMDDLSLRKPD